MAVLYYSISLIIIIIYLKNNINDIRSLILMGLVFQSLFINAMPWSIVPINGVAFSIQLFFMFLCILYSIKQRTVISFPRNKYFILFILSLILFSFIIFSFNLYTPSIASSYGWNKTTLFLLKCMLPVVALILMIPYKKGDIKKIITVILVGSALTAVKLLLTGDVYSERANFGETNPITIAREIGFGLVVALLLRIIYPKSEIINIKLLNLVIGLLCISLLITGSRGPMLSVILTVLLGCVLIKGKIMQKFKSLVFVVIIFSTLFISISTNLIELEETNFNSITRMFEYITTTGENTSDTARLEMYEIAKDEIERSKYTGVGTGGFLSVYGTSSDRAYPHNIVLEILLEQGFLGLLLFLFIIFLVSIVIFKINRNKDEGYYKVVTPLFYFTLFNALLSGDIPQNSALWITGGIVIIIFASYRNLNVGVKK